MGRIVSNRLTYSSNDTDKPQSYTDDKDYA
jgi:hypothetical protein